MEKFCGKIIEWGFYFLFFSVPLIFYAGSYELFEYNKMMLVYGLTIVIFAAWLIRLITNRQSLITPWKWVPRTPLDIPILLYLLAHILSTIFSIDPHVSIWGYYSRFHEGLLATISYILLYYAAVSNLNRHHVVNILKLSLLSGLIVAIYGIFEHFGASLSCLLITGKFNVDCWVQDVKNRVFATLGQPNWMAAYLDIVILASFGLLFKEQFSKRTVLFENRPWIYLLVPPLFFAALLFTKSRSGILGLALGLVVFAGTLIHTYRKNLKLLLFNRFLILSSILFLISSIIFGLPFSQTEKFSLENFLVQKTATSIQQPFDAAQGKPVSSNQGYIDIGISESSDIRKVVWAGAVKVWQRYPIFGSGVETFAYAYYKDRPIEHNMLSEWDFLYNKAHNEYLNLLATTGTVGFIAYLAIIFTFIFGIISNFKLLIFNKFLNIKLNNKYELENNNYPILLGMFAAWVSILVTNFFGFSVVIIGLFFFLIPAFCYLLVQPEKESPCQGESLSRNEAIEQSRLSTFHWLTIAAVLITTLQLQLKLLSMWRADKAFAYGKNLDGANQYVAAYPYLTTAVRLNGGEPTFRDELSYNQAVLASTIFAQIQTSSASAIASLSAQEKMAITIPQLSVSANDLITQSIDNSNRVVETSPHALTFAKTRTKMFYALSTIDNKYILDALAAIRKANELAPTDAKVHYNLAILYGRVGQINNAVTALEETVTMKPDYRDAYYALSLYYKESGDINKARSIMQQILSKIGPDPDARKWLEENQ